MSVESQIPRKQYQYTGTAPAYAVEFSFVHPKDLAVIHTSAEGVDTTLILNSQYTVTTDDQGTGAVSVSDTTLDSSSAARLTIHSNLKYEQQTKLIDTISPSSLEGALDRLTLQNQQQQEQIDRCAKLPVTSGGTADNYLGQCQTARNEAVAASSSAVPAGAAAEAARDEAVLAKDEAVAAKDEAKSIVTGDLDSLRTPAPILSGDTEGNEGAVLYVIIGNYDAVNTYSASVTGGTVGSVTVIPDGLPNAGEHAFPWTLPTLDADADYSISAAAEGILLKSRVVTRTITVKDIPVQPGATKVWPGTTEAWKGATVDAEGVHAPAYSVGTDNAAQITSVTPSLLVVNGKLIVLDGTTESVLKLAMLVAAGDVLLTDQGEVFVASVTETPINYEGAATSQTGSSTAVVYVDNNFVIPNSISVYSLGTQIPNGATASGTLYLLRKNADSTLTRVASVDYSATGTTSKQYFALSVPYQVPNDGLEYYVGIQLISGSYLWESVNGLTLPANPVEGTAYATGTNPGIVSVAAQSISYDATLETPLTGVPTKAFQNPLKTKLNWNISGSTASVLKLKENYIGKIFTNVGESEIVSNNGEVSPPESLLPRYMTQAANGVTITTTNAGNCQTVYCITDDGDNLSYCFSKSTSPTVTITFAEAKQIDHFSVWLKECGLGLTYGHELINARDIVIMGRLNSGAWQTLYSVTDHDWYAAATIDEDALVPGLYNEIQITMGDNAHATYTYVISPRFQFYTAGAEVDGVLAEALPGIPSWVYKPSDFALKVGAGAIGEYIGPQEALKLDGGIVQLHEDIATFPNGSATRTLVDLSRKIPNGVTVSKFLWNSGNFAGGGYNQAIKMKIVKQTAANTFDVVVDQTIDCAGREGNVYYSDDLVTPYTIPETGDYYVAIYVQGTTPWFSFWSMTAGENANLEGADMTGTGNITTSSAYVFAIGWEELGSSSTASVVTKGGSSVKDKILKAGGLHKTLLFDGVEKEVSAVSEVVSQGGPEIIADQGTFIHSTTTPGYEDINPLVNSVDTNLYWGGNDVGPAAVDTVYVGSQFAEDTTVHGFYLRQAGNASTGANSMTSVMVQESTDGIKWTDVEQITITEFGLNLGQYTLTTPRTGKFMRLLAKSNTLCAACGWAVSYLRWFGLADVCITTILPTVELPQVPSSVAIPDRCTLTPANYAYALDSDDLKITGAEIVLEDNPELKRLAMAVSGEGLIFKNAQANIMEKL